MFKRNWLPAVLMLPLTLSACGGDDTSPFQRFFDLQREALEFSCECAVAAGQIASVEACLALVDFGFTPAQEECLASEFSKVSGANAAGECAADAADTYLSCIQAEGCGDPTATFTCGDGSTIPESFVCDGEADCPDGEDEANCDGNPSCQQTYETAVDACPVVSDADVEAVYMACGIDFDAGDYECADGSTIPEDWVCDGVDDCDGGEDEANCG